MFDSSQGKITQIITQISHKIVQNIQFNSFEKNLYFCMIKMLILKTTLYI